MEYRNLDSSSLKVSVLGLGGNNFGKKIDEQGSAAVISCALELGINIIDTADGTTGDDWKSPSVGRSNRGGHRLLSPQSSPQ